MSVPTDTRRSERRRGGKKRWLLIPAIAVILLAAALVWLNSVYVYAEGFHRRDSAQIDLRGKSISEQKYLRLCGQLPNCEIFWDVPIGGGTFGCVSETIAEHPHRRGTLSLRCREHHADGFRCVRAAAF